MSSRRWWALAVIIIAAALVLLATIGRLSTAASAGTATGDTLAAPPDSLARGDSGRTRRGCGF